MSNYNLCPNCFGRMNENGVCISCGYNVDKAGEYDYDKLTPCTIIKDRYYIGKALGQGGFGITYLAYDLNLDIKLAIKEYYPTGFATRIFETGAVKANKQENRKEFEQGKNKFLDEARTLAKFEEHQNIVTVKDYFEYNGTAYMVMNCLEGRTLLQYIKEQGGKISYPETYKILSPVMDALNLIHASGIIHRDISPDNIFITNNGQPKLLDFGAAKSAMALANQQNHSIILKKGYSPAEQYQENGRLGPWTDIYSMAATIYRCITGQLPQDAVDRLIADNLILPSSMGINILPHIEQALKKAMSLNPQNRYQNMSDFKDALINKKTNTANKPPLYNTKKQNTQKKQGTNPINSGRQTQNTPNSGTSASKLSAPKYIIIAAGVLLAILILLMVLFGRTDYYAEGERYYKAEDYSNAKQYFEKASDKGDASAMNYLGKMYEKGQGVSQDYTEAVKWYQKAAEAGDAAAMYNLGYMYDEGQGVSKDYSQAKYWYERSAKFGNTGAMNNLGYMYEHGYGVAQDYAEAVKWYQKAAEAGNAGAMNNLGYMYDEGNGVSRNYAEAVKWYKKAAENGEVSSMYNLGMMYEEGHGVSKDYSQAKYWYQQAADKGSTNAKNKLSEWNH